MSPNHTPSAYAARLVADPELQTEAIELSYTDPHTPARNLLARIAPALGSNLYRLRAGEHELIYHDRQNLLEHGHTGTFVLWPFPNRVRDARYTYRGQRYTFANVPRKGPLIHGLVFDRAWAHEQLTADEKQASVTTTVEMNADQPYFEAYPFPSRLSLTYVLTSEGLTVTYTVKNTGEQTLPTGFALHPYFTLLGQHGQTSVTLPADRVMEADEGLLPTGRLLDVHSTMYAMFDLNQPTPVSQLKLDHVYTNLPAQHEALIEYHDLGLRVRFATSEDFTHAVIYTPAQSPFFCLENQTCSTDAINLHQRGMQDIAHLLEVQPGEQVSGFIRYAIEQNA